MTGDHIPPISFFPPPPPPDLIVIPCCEKCNGDYKLDDEAVRVWFTAPLGTSSAGEWIFKNKVLPGTIKGSPAFAKKMLASMKEVKVSGPAGEGKAIALRMPRDRVEQWIIRITKGLLKHHYPNYDYSSAQFDVLYIGQNEELREKLGPLRGQLSYDEKGGEVFQYRHGVTKSGESGLWILGFYRATIFFVSHTTNDSDDSPLLPPKLDTRPPSP